MDQYCVVVCGLRAGASDEALAWAPVAAALRMEQDEFARRVLAALPRVVRQQLDLATAERIAQLLQGLHVDARALPDDARLAYIERDGRSRGPLPQSALDMFIEPGEPYRLQGSHAWETWPEPPEHEATIAPAQAFDEAVVAHVDELPVEAPADHVEGEAEAPSTEDISPASMPPLPTEPSPPETSASTLDDEVMADDALINPPQEEEEDSATAEELAESPAEAGTDQPRRSRYGRLLVLLVIAGVAAWAYLHWMADSRVDDTPPPAPVAHASHPADSATTAPGSTTSVGAAPVPAASAAAAGASSTPAPATSAPAAGGTATLPAAASAIAAPAAAAGAAPAQASSTVPATATSAPPAHAGSAAATPAAASSSPQG